MIPEPVARENMAYGRLSFNMIERSYTTQGNRILPRRWLPVTLAEAGVQFHCLDSSLRRNDEVGHSGSNLTGVASRLSALKKMRLPCYNTRTCFRSRLADAILRLGQGTSNLVWRTEVPFR